MRSEALYRMVRDEAKHLQVSPMYLLTIVTPEKIFYEDEVGSLIAPGSEGYLGVLTDHAPLITALVPGKLTVKDQKNQELIFALGGGFLEVLKNKVTVLAHSIEIIKDIDIERAKRAMERAKQRLRSKEMEIDIPRAIAALRRAENRLYLYENAIEE
jgi:F-type H+-transporting ATPase subunit epsilon